MDVLGVTMPFLDDEEIRFRVDAGTPIIDPELVVIDYATFNLLFQELKDILARKSGKAEARDLEFLKDVELSEKEVEQLGRAWMEGRERFITSRADELDVDNSVIFLLLHATFSACFRKLAEELLSRADLDQCPGADCPVCGAPPVMGLHREGDGLRVLECSLCGTRWGTPRMICLFCGTPDQKKLRYLFVNEDQARRIQVCENCRTYIKIIDCKEITEEVVLPLEDIYTIYLDEVAVKEGYERGCRTVFS